MSGDNKESARATGTRGLPHRYLTPLIVCGGLCFAPQALAIDAAVKGVKGATATNVVNFLAGMRLEGDAPAERYEDEIIRRTQEALQAFGYYDAQITLSYPEKGLLGGDDVVVTVDAGEPVTIETLELRLEGDAARDKVMKKVLADADLEEGDVLRHSRYDSLKSTLTSLSLERGYFDTSFSQQRIEVRPWLHSARIYLVMQSGQRYRFGDITYLNSQIELDRVKAMQPFEIGDYYEAGKLTQFNQRLSEAGWFRSAAIKPQLNPGAELKTTSPDSEIKTPYAEAQGYEGSWLADVERAEVEGTEGEQTGDESRRADASSRSDTTVSAAQAAVEADDADSDVAGTTEAAGNDTPVLTGDALEAAVKTANGPIIPVDISLIPADRHKFETGIGYATDVGPRLQFSWEMPWVNRYGHSLTNSLFLSSPEQTFEGEYRMPLEDPLKDSYVLEYGMSNTDDEDTESLETTVRFTREWKFDNGWTQRVFFGSTYEDYTQADESGAVLLLYPGVSWNRTRTRPKTFPMWGDRQQLTFEYGDQMWGSDVTFLRSQFNTNWIRSIGDNHRFVARMGVGHVDTDNFDDMPPSMRFFTGGDNSVRGYSYETLAPEDDDGDLEGGSSLLTSSLEYDYRLTGDWWGATFYDAGNAFNGWDALELKTAAGMGIRWISPVGPIRLDIAHPFDDDDNDYRIHFSIGPEF
ncbi:autotransporter assembly complex family protein [Cobetia sp.]|uniref:autotransporter assembly complex protein TamA n=1 Tax=Cobetia sp. TaxID=1873876 RepID=UPI00257F61B2|nr:autotransporter assembly complex family protein [Cobetia sp.]|tara:strand:- start:972 stop:3053 length:2082 start_codon:yes stop_codon:yes gene_type:complete